MCGNANPRVSPTKALVTVFVTRSMWMLASTELEVDVERAEGRV